MNKLEIKDLKKLIDATTEQLETTEHIADINHIIENLITTVVDSEYASLWVFDKNSAILKRARKDNTLKEISMLGQQGVLAKCFFTLSNGIYNYLASEKGYLPAVDNPDQIKIKSKIIVPIIDKEYFLGMVTAYSSIKKIKNFNQDDMELLQAMTPFLIKTIYKMYPHMQKEKEYLSDNIGFEKASEKIVEKVEQIQKTPPQIQSDDMVNFLANTVHDIRTPANTLYGFLELLEAHLHDERLLQYIHNAKESAHFINDLTTSILDRISSQKEQKHTEPVTISPTKFFADIAEGFAANMYNKQIIFNIYIDPFLPKEIKLDTMLLKRVLMNLLNNAYKFTPEKKSVELSVKYHTDKEEIMVGVTDTGIGIAEEKQQEIFYAFTQAEETTKAQYGGTGLGLAICADYVRKLGGELKLKSRLEKGSSFYFTIPLTITAAQPMFSKQEKTDVSVGIILDKSNIESSKNILRYLSRMGLKKENITVLMKGKVSEGKLTHLICFQHLLNNKIQAFAKREKLPLLIIEETFLSLGSEEQEKDNLKVISQYGYYAPQLQTFITENLHKRVLVVDDDKINIELIKAILSEEFCQVDTAQDGKTALEKLKEGISSGDPYTLVFLDMHMPIYAGTEVIRMFRAYEKEKCTAPVFAVSISGDTLQHSNHSDFNGYVAKPFNRNKIKAILKEVCKA